jgi:hypothetical protein
LIFDEKNEPSLRQSFSLSYASSSSLSVESSAEPSEIPDSSSSTSYPKIPHKPLASLSEPSLPTKQTVLTPLQRSYSPPKYLNSSSSASDKIFESLSKPKNSVLPTDSYSITLKSALLSNNLKMINRILFVFYFILFFFSYLSIFFCSSMRDSSIIESTVASLDLNVIPLLTRVLCYKLSSSNSMMDFKLDNEIVNDGNAGSGNSFSNLYGSAGHSSSTSSSSHPHNIHRKPVNLQNTHTLVLWCFFFFLFIFLTIYIFSNTVAIDSYILLEISILIRKIQF